MIACDADNKDPPAPGAALLVSWQAANGRRRHGFAVWKRSGSVQHRAALDGTLEPQRVSRAATARIAVEAPFRFRSRGQGRCPWRRVAADAGTRRAVNPSQRRVCWRADSELGSLGVSALKPSDRNGSGHPGADPLRFLLRRLLHFLLRNSHAQVVMKRHARCRLEGRKGREAPVAGRPPGTAADHRPAGRPFALCPSPADVGPAALLLLATGHSKPHVAP